MLRIPRSVKIVYVDHDGYCGRDHHPLDSDIGLVCKVLRVDIERADEDDDDSAYAVFIVSTPDNRILELVEHEIKQIHENQKAH